jgi:uncharacterized protein with HEPN domain
MLPEVAKYLYDVRQACDLLNEFTQGKTLEDYQNDKLLRSAVERQFIIVGEALMQAEKLHPKLTFSVSVLRQIIGFRNVLVHGYAVIKHQTVWGIFQHDLPVLRKEVEDILAESESEK